MNEENIICLIAGLAVGFIVAFINMLITKRGMKAESVNGVMALNAVRFLLDLVALTAGFFVCKNFDLPLVETLLGIAIGLSVGGIMFLFLLVKKNKKGGE